MDNEKREYAEKHLAEHMKEIVTGMIDRDMLIRWTLEAKDREIETLKNTCDAYLEHAVQLEQLVKRYHALLDTWDLEIADHVPHSIAQAAEEEKDDLQREAARLLGA